MDPRYKCRRSRGHLLSPDAEPPLLVAAGAPVSAMIIATGRGVIRSVLEPTARDTGGQRRWMIREPTLEILRGGIPSATPALEELRKGNTAYAISQTLEEMSDFAISAVRWVEEREGVSYEKALEYVLSGTRPQT